MLIVVQSALDNYAVLI